MIEDRMQLASFDALPVTQNVLSDFDLERSNTLRRRIHERLIFDVQRVEFGLHSPEDFSSFGFVVEPRDVRGGFDLGQFV